MKKPLILFAVAAVVVLVIWSWWSHRHHENDGVLVLQGNVDIRQISLSFDGIGRVEALHVEEGDKVKAGSVLGSLNTRALELQAQQAQAQIGVQEQALLSLRNGARPQEIAQARSRLTAAQSDTVQAEQEFIRLQKVAASTQNGVSVQDVDRARNTFQVAKAKEVELREALRLAELGPRAEQIAGAEAQLKAAQAQLALLQYQIDQGQLKAPADAIVRSRLLEPGDMATPQRPVFTLALTQPKWIRVYVGEPDLGKVHPGMEVKVSTDSQPNQSITGKVGYISAVAEFTPKSVQAEELRTSLVYEVRVRVDDASDVLRLGQPATVRLNIGKAQ